MATDEAVFLLQKPSPAKPGTVFQKMCVFIIKKFFK